MNICETQNDSSWSDGITTEGSHRSPAVCYGPGFLRCSPHIERAADGEVSAAGDTGDGETRIALALAARISERDTRPTQQS